MKKRLTSIILCAAMAAVGYTGAANAYAEGEDVHVGELPIVDDQITVDVLTTRWGSMGDSFISNKFLTDLEEESNIKIDWTVQSLNDWGEQKSILLASGTLPSVIFGNQSLNDSDVLSNLDYFLPLDDLIENYMPNYKAVLASNAELRKLTTYPDGHIYSFGASLPGRPIVSNQLVINQVWLDNLGLEVPTTLDELYDVLKAFKEQDANGNGDPNDEIPIAAVGMYNLLPFGYDAIDSDMLLRDGELTYAKTSEAYKEGMKWLQKLYAEGIIDPECFTQDSTILTSKQQDTEVARVGMSYEWSADAVFGQWFSEYTIIPAISGPDGNIYAYGDINGVYSLSRNQAFITTFCEYPEAVAAWIDKFYTDEATIQNFWGAFGTVMSKNDDGTYSLLDPPEGTSADAWYWEQSLRDFGPGYASEGLNDKLRLSTVSGDGLKLITAKLDEDYIGTPFPNVMYTEEETEELAMLTTDINKYVDEIWAQWISDSSFDIDAGWENYVAQLNMMGLEDLIAIRTAAYERFIEE